MKRANRTIGQCEPEPRFDYTCVWPGTSEVRALAAALIAIATTLFLSCGDSGTDPALPPAPIATTVSVTPASAALTAIGETVRFTAEVRDQNGQPMANAPVAWSSSDASVASVDAAALVTAAGNGATTITATSGNASGSAAVTVAQAVSTVTMTPTAATLVEGDTLRLSAEAADANGHAVAGAEFTWSSSDTLVATVDAAGLVIAAGPDEAVVSATTDGAEGQARIVVEPRRPTTVVISPDTLLLTALGDAVALSVEVSDQSGRTMKEVGVSWSSADTLVAKVDSVGVVTANGPGTTGITAAVDSVTGHATAIVEQAIRAVAVIPDSATVGPGDTLRLSAEATDANGHAVADAAFEWSSSNTLVATVDTAGLVTAVDFGEAIVSAKTDEAEGRARIAVEPAATVEFTEDSVRIVEGETHAVGIRYRIRKLSAPLAIEVVVAEDGARAADYELSQTRFDIPAGTDIEGTFDLTLGASADKTFAEGDEGFFLRLAASENSRIGVGETLPVMIRDAPVSIDPGITLAGTRPLPVAAAQGLSYLQSRDRMRTTLTSEWHPSSQGVTVRWVGPYGTRREWIDVKHHPYYTDEAQPNPPQPDFHIESWRVERKGSSVTHVMDISWPADDKLEIMFRDKGGNGLAVCNAEGCVYDAGVAANSSALPTQEPQREDPGGNPTGIAPPFGGPIVDFSEGAHDAGASNRSAAYLHERGWDQAVWGPGDTLVFHLSSENWPEDARMTPDEAKEVLEKMLAEWSAIPTADILWRVEGPVAGLEVGRDGKNIFWVDPGYVHGGGRTNRWYNSRGQLVELDHRIDPNSVRNTKQTYENSPWHYNVNEMGMHPLGHTLGLGHAATFPVARSCPGPTYAVQDCGRVNGDLDYWRTVSGAWQVSPIMAYGADAGISWVDRAAASLRLDDKIGVSLLRPRPGWLATTGTITGSVRTDDGRPVPHIHVWAVQPTKEGLMDGVGVFADRNGYFWIRGLPPGDWILIAHPDLEWLANPWFFYERQGELTDEMLLYPVRARAGQTTGGIEITMSRGRVTTGGVAR